MPDTIFFSSMHRWPWQRQMPAPQAEGEGVWRSGQDRFLIASELPAAAPVEPYDCWVTWDEPWQGRMDLHLPLERRVLFVTEPPEYKDYSILLPVHGVVVTPYDFGAALPLGVRQILAPPLINWHYGVDMTDRATPLSRMDFASMAAMPQPEKKHLCSIVCSNLTTLPAHRERVLFFKALRAVFKDTIDFFGRGHGFVADKKDSMDSYRYAICLENTLCPGFWTEKAADAYLGYAMPIYCGCSDFAKWFPEGSFARVDFRRPDEAMRIIAALLEEDPWERALPAIVEARQRLLREYNFFTALPRLLAALPDLQAGRINAQEAARRYLSG